MEENIDRETAVVKESNKHICFENHCWKKCLAMVIAAFLGGFLAFYFVSDQMMKRKYYHYFSPQKFEKKIFNDIDKMYRQDIKAFEDAFGFDNPRKMHFENFAMPVFMMDTVKVKTEFDDDKFKVIIGLKPFQGDEEKIKYNVNGRKLTVFGSSTLKEKDFEHDVSFSQDFILPENADVDNVTKEKNGDKLIILVPIKEK